jgi:hypothetical protein
MGAYNEVNTRLLMKPIGKELCSFKYSEIVLTNAQTIVLEVYAF